MILGLHRPDLRKSYIEIETDKDHIHLLVKSEPKISALMIVRKLKQETTVRMWKTHSRYLSRFYWKERTLWNDGYFVCTIVTLAKKEWLSISEIKDNGRLHPLS